MNFLVSLVGYSSNFSEFWMEENHFYHHCFFEQKDLLLTSFDHYSKNGWSTSIPIKSYTRLQIPSLGQVVVHLDCKHEIQD